MESNINTLAKSISGYIDTPDKYVYPFVIKEKNGKERTIITYNKLGNYGDHLRNVHSYITEAFKINFAERNIHSFAYHKNVRCYDALQSHLKSNVFIKLDIHHFFESITEEAFFELYGEYFNSDWKAAIKGLFYKGSLSIGFVSSPLISDFFMKRFDKDVEGYLNEHPELHYSRYSDDILLSSELDNEKSLDELFEFVKDRLSIYHLELNDKKTKKVQLDFKKHNSISFLGLNLSKQDEVNNKITISKRYILFILFLIAKQKRYTDHCYALDNEIKSRVAYLAYNSPISYQRFQKKHINIYGEPYDFVPKAVEQRSEAPVSTEIPDFEELSKKFQINIHKTVAGQDKGGFVIKDAIEIEKYLGNEQSVVEIPYFVDSIGKDAFKGHIEIKKIVLNEKLKNIEGGAFAGCLSLKEINLVDALRYIGKEAFRNTHLKSVVIPSKLKKISESTFAICTSLEEITISEGVEIIEPKAFAFSKVRKVRIPQSLKEIGSSAFLSCDYLQDINIKDSNVEIIGPSAFKECILLKEINLPKSLRVIGSSAFEKCSNLRSIYIPASTLEIGIGAFAECYNLASIEVDRENKVYLHRDDNASLVDSNKTLFFSLEGKIDEDIVNIGPNAFANSFVRNIVIPEGVKSIGDNAFNCSMLLKTISLPESLESIGKEAFANCVSLKEIKLPNSIKNIPYGLFNGCCNLKKIIMSDEIKSFGGHAFENCGSLELKLPKSLEVLGAYSLSKCTSIKHLCIPQGVKKIERDAFMGLSNSLESIEVDPLNPIYCSGDNSNIIYLRKKAAVLLGCKNSKIDVGIKSIYKYAFAYCDGLKSISFPNTINKIEDAAFVGCKNLEHIDLNLVHKIGSRAFENTGALKHIDLPHSLTLIDSEAFKGSGLVDLVIPESLIGVGEEAFTDCKQLESISIPSTFKPIYVNLAFKGLENLKTISVNSNNTLLKSPKGSNIMMDNFGSLMIGAGLASIPQDVNTILQSAFEGNKQIKEIEIPETVNTISSSAFRNSSLKRIVIKAKIDKISESLFEKCRDLEEVILPDGITEIATKAFAGCKKLKSIVLPKSVKVIGFDAFKNSGIEHIDLPESLEVINDGAFEGCVNLKAIDLTKIQLTRIGGRLFANTLLEKVEIPSCFTSIPDNCFTNCKELTEVDIDGELQNICSSAFEGCSNLTTIKLPNCVKTIEARAFLGCLSLGKFDLPSSLEMIGSDAFRDCSNLVISRLPDSLLAIYDSAFVGCKNLKSIRIPKNISLLVSNAFIGCNLESISVANDHPYLRDEGKNVVVYDDPTDNKVKLLLGCKNSIIPNDVNVILSSAFSYIDELTNINFPKSLKEIGRYAFYGCKSLKDITLNDGLEYICSCAFEGTKLKKLHLPASLQTISLNGIELDEIDVDKENKAYISNGDNILLGSDYEILWTGKNATLPKQYTTIYEGCFDGQKFEKVFINEPCVSVSGFSNCGTIEEFHLPKSVKRIKNFAFNTHIKKIFVDKDNLWFATNDEHTKLFDITKTILYYSADGDIPEGVKVVKWSNLRHKGIEKLYIPSTLYSLTTPREHIDIEHVKSVNVSADNPYYEGYKNTIIRKNDGALVFIPNNSDIPDGIRKIACEAFSGGSLISAIHIPASVKYIEKHTFDACDAIESIVVDKDNPIFESRGNCLIVKKSGVAIAKAKDAQLPEGVVLSGCRGISSKINDGYHDCFGDKFNCGEPGGVPKDNKIGFDYLLF